MLDQVMIHLYQHNRCGMRSVASVDRPLSVTSRYYIRLKLVSTDVALPCRVRLVYLAQICPVLITPETGIPDTIRTVYLIRL